MDMAMPTPPEWVFLVQQDPIEPKDSLKGEGHISHDVPASSDLITSAVIKYLEDNIAQLNGRQAKLVARNLQLAKVLELALALDSIGTPDGLCRKVVGLAAEIHGV